MNSRDLSSSRFLIVCRSITSAFFVHMCCPSSYVPVHLPFHTVFCSALRDVQAVGKMLLHKCDSLPQLLVGESLLQELGIDHAGRHSAMSLNDIQEEDDLDTDRSLPMRASVINCVPCLCLCDIQWCKFYRQII